MHTTEASDGGQVILAVRCPRSLVERLECVATAVNRPKSEIVHFLLSRLTEADLQPGWLEAADDLRRAREVRG
jgi:hypothetical protein